MEATVPTCRKLNNDNCSLRDIFEEPTDAGHVPPGECPVSGDSERDIPSEGKG